MDVLLEILLLIGLSSIKFFFAPLASLSAGFNYFQTILITSLGGIAGVVVFYYFGGFITDRFQQWWRQRQRRNKPKKTFSKRNKLIVKTKITYGLVGLALITPVALSIPLGSVVAARFFRHNRMAIPVLISSVVFWSFTLTTLFSLGIIK